MEEWVSHMNKLIAIMQPTYMPWLGYFSMIDQAEEFIFLDNVQLVNRSWQVRNKIKFGEAEKMLTIPVNKDKARDDRLIYVTAYSGEDWKKSHLGQIRQAYSKSLYFNEIMPFIENLYKKHYFSIGEMNELIIMEICKKIGIKTPFFLATTMNVSGHKDGLLVNICKERNADAYLSAQGSAAYIEASNPAGEFGKNNIELYYLNYEHPCYNQICGKFIPYIGIYDLLFNEGFEAALDIIRSGARVNYTSDEFRRTHC